tara:strand:+ start:73 stop:693 length:621 start_codon:yes stop_codon:yes gene_type:complete
MKFIIKHQESYNRGELILRSFCGGLYILLPHNFLLIFIQIGLMFINIGRFWIILFTGKWPEGMHSYAVKTQRYGLRVSARMLNLSDGYPKFGLSGTDDNTDFDIEHKESYSRGRLIVRGLFGPLLAFPHIFVLAFKLIGVYFVLFISWWAVLFTGKYPKGMHNFVVGVLRHNARLGNYLYFLSDGYPSFSNSPAEGEITEFDSENN